MSGLVESSEDLNVSDNFRIVLSNNNKKAQRIPEKIGKDGVFFAFNFLIVFRLRFNGI